MLGMANSLNVATAGAIVLHEPVRRWGARWRWSYVRLRRAWRGEEAGSTGSGARRSLRVRVLGAMVAVRCPSDFDPLMRQAGGQWEPGSRRWLIERRRLGPLVRELRRATDPLFRHVGINLDEP